MSDLPKCKLCGALPTTSPTPWGGSVVHTCSSALCAIYGIWFTPAQWRALMAPPVITDAMVERGMDTMRGGVNRLGPEALTRAVLEAALKCDAVAAGRDFEECRDRYDTLMSDYAAVKAERDELARALMHDPYAWTNTHAKCTGRCRGCGELEALVEFKARTHAPGCPVALAEKIVKEAGDGR